MALWFDKGHMHFVIVLNWHIAIIQAGQTSSSKLMKSVR